MSSTPNVKGEAYGWPSNGPSAEPKGGGASFGASQWDNWLPKYANVDQSERAQHVLNSGLVLLYRFYQLQIVQLIQLVIGTIKRLVNLDNHSKSVFQGQGHGCYGSSPADKERDGEKNIEKNETRQTNGECFQSALSY